MIYFDNSATTKPYPESVKVFSDVAGDFFGNPSSLHGLGLKSGKLLQQARQIAANSLGVSSGELIFTSGGTESNNSAIKGVALAYRERGKHIITSAIEHASVYETCKQLEDLGYTVTVLPVNRKGIVSVEDVKKALREDTILVSIMQVNSELGSIQPIGEIASLLSHYPKVLFHVDGVQGFGKLPVMPKKWGIDLLSLSAHKFHGGRGTGLLYVRQGVKLSPLMSGGGQEQGRRSGTENLPGIVAMARAMKIGMGNLGKNQKHMSRLRDHLITRLKELPYCILNSPEVTNVEGAPQIVNFSCPGLKSEVIVHALEDYDIYVSTRSACSSKNDKPSRVLLAAGMDVDRAKSALRVSFSPENTIEEVDRFIEAVEQTVPKLAKIMRV